MEDISNPGRSLTSIHKILECPVCHNLPKPPIFGCQNGHVICENCIPRVKFCPVCRAEKFNVRNIIVEELLTSKFLDCPNRSSGCTAGQMNEEQFSFHVRVCPKRPIDCELKIGLQPCGARVRPENYFHHLEDVHYLSEPHHAEYVITSSMGPDGFTPFGFEFESRSFCVNSQQNESRFWTWVSVGGDSTNVSSMSPANNKNYYSIITLRCPKTGTNMIETFSSGVIRCCDIRETPQEVLKKGHCLEVTAAGPSSIHIPHYVWPAYIPQHDVEQIPEWGYEIKVWPVDTKVFNIPAKRQKFSHTVAQTQGISNAVQRPVPVLANFGSSTQPNARLNPDYRTPIEYLADVIAAHQGELVVPILDYSVNEDEYEEDAQWSEEEATEEEVDQEATNSEEISLYLAPNNLPGSNVPIDLNNVGTSQTSELAVTDSPDKDDESPLPTTTSNGSMLNAVAGIAASVFRRLSSSEVFDSTTNENLSADANQNTNAAPESTETDGDDEEVAALMAAEDNQNLQRND